MDKFKMTDEEYINNIAKVIKESGGILVQKI